MHVERLALDKEHAHVREHKHPGRDKKAHPHAVGIANPAASHGSQHHAQAECGCRKCQYGAHGPVAARRSHVAAQRGWDKRGQPVAKQADQIQGQGEGQAHDKRGDQPQQPGCDQKRPAPQAVGELAGRDVGDRHRQAEGAEHQADLGLAQQELPVQIDRHKIKEHPLAKSPEQ